MDLPTSWSSTHGWITSWVLPCLAVVLLALRHAAHRAVESGRMDAPRRARLDRVVTGGLLLAAALSVATYVDFGRFRYGTYVNEWDTYHYYLGTKYLAELGYDGLYEATVLADHESVHLFRGENVRDLRTYELVPTHVALESAQRVRARFTPARWREFVADVAWFERGLPSDRLAILLEDHGYNGSPPWSATVGLLTNGLSFRSALERWAIVSIDPLLLGLMVVAVGWAFGRNAAAVVVILVGTHYLLSWGHLKGCILRTDFAACAVIAASLLRKERFAAAGAMLGWSVVARAFPIVFAFGPGLLLLTTLARERRLDRDLVRFFVAMGAVVVGACTLAALRYGGLEVFTAWLAKIQVHTVEGSDWNIGLRPLVDVRFVDGLPEQVFASRVLEEEPELAAMRNTVLWSVRLAALVPATYFATFLKPHQAFAFGFVYLFFLVSPDYYYFLILCVPLVYYLDSEHHLHHTVGVGFMLLTGAFGYLLFSGWERMRDVSPIFHGFRQTFGTTYFLSWALELTVLHMIALAALRGYALTKQRSTVRVES